VDSNSVEYWGDDGNTVLDVPDAGHPETVDIVDLSYGPGFAGYAGKETEIHAAPVAYAPSVEADGMTSDHMSASADPGIDPDYDVNGRPGSIEVAYSIGGPVEPNQVENFELTGRLLVPGRDDEHAPGPVGAEEYRSDLIMQIVQAMGPEITPEAAALGLVGF